MKHQDLYYFRTLAETRSFTQTAEAFYISQPSISIALKRLETEFGLSLINRDRSSKSVELTEAGELFFKRCIEITDLLDQTKKDMDSLGSKIVTLGFLPTIGGHFLPQIMSKLTEYLVDLNFFEEESSDAMYELVQKGEVTAAIVGSDKKIMEGSDLIQAPIAQKQLHLWVSPSHPLAGYKRINSRMLKETHFVTLAKGYTHQRIFEKWAKKHQINDSHVHYTNEIQTANSMIASGMTAGLMIDSLVRDRTDIVKLELTDAPEFYVSMLVNPKAIQSDKQRAFNDLLIETVENLF
ncbi:LysR family transcriptional regulator [Alkalibacterium sp.]|nr:MAG: LysR family transcriptional regulator [Alkalibacterium sp.]